MPLTLLLSFLLLLSLLSLLLQMLLLLLSLLLLAVTLEMELVSAALLVSHPDSNLLTTLSHQKYKMFGKNAKLQARPLTLTKSGLSDALLVIALGRPIKRPKLCVLRLCGADRLCHSGLSDCSHVILLSCRSLRLPPCNRSYLPSHCAH